MEQAKPDNPSGDHNAMADYWSMASTILGGTAAMRRAGKAYLPKFDAESEEAYETRRKQAKFTNIFRDILENLAQKPFASEVSIADGADSRLIEFCEDVDGEGNPLHTFAGETMFNGIANAVDWVLVDYTRAATEGATVAQERAEGVRPYWCHYPADSVLAAHSAKIDGVEQFVHVRLAETVTEVEGFTEVTISRVRFLDREDLGDGQYGPAKWVLWEKKKAEGASAEEWELVDGGDISIGVIPIVPFIAGRRVGKTWQFHPPMRDAADLQIEHYQQENGLKNAKNLTAFPMLAGNGVSPEMGADGKPVPLTVGPSTVLYAPGSEGKTASWAFVEPNASSLTFLAKDIDATARELRELGRQPLTAQSGNLTVVTTAFAAQKGNSAVQAWALNLKAALENALKLTALWLKVDGKDAAVTINTDFDIGIGDDDTFESVIKMYEDEVISREALLHEAKRRGIVDKDFDPEADLEQILAEMGGQE